MRVSVRGALLLCIAFLAGVGTANLARLPRAASMFATPVAAATIGPPRPRQEPAVCPPPGSAPSPASYDAGGPAVAKYECFWPNFSHYLCPPGFNFAEGSGDFGWFGGGAANITGMFWHCVQVKVAKN